MEKFSKNQKGFTLVELLVAGMILCIVLTSVYAFLNASSKVSVSINDHARRENELVNVTEAVRATLANAQEVHLISQAGLAQANRRDGYMYLFCDGDGGLKMYNGTNPTPSSGVGCGLRNEKIIVTFSASDSENLKSLNYNVYLYPTDNLDSGALDAIKNFNGIYTTDLGEKLNAVNTDYFAKSNISFHNCEELTCDYNNLDVDPYLRDADGNMVTDPATGSPVLKEDLLYACAIEFKDPQAAGVIEGGDLGGVSTTTNESDSSTSTESTTETSTESTESTTEMFTYYLDTDPPQSLDGGKHMRYKIIIINHLVPKFNDDGVRYGYSLDIPVDPAASIRSVAAFPAAATYTPGSSAIKVHSGTRFAPQAAEYYEYVDVYYNVPEAKLSVDTSGIHQSDDAITGQIVLKNVGSLAGDNMTWDATIQANEATVVGVEYNGSDATFSTAERSVTFSGTVSHLEAGESKTIDIGRITIKKDAKVNLVYTQNINDDGSKISGYISIKNEGDMDAVAYPIEPQSVSVNGTINDYSSFHSDWAVISVAGNTVTFSGNVDLPAGSETTINIGEITYLPLPDTKTVTIHVSKTKYIEYGNEYWHNYGDCFKYKVYNDAQSWITVDGGDNLRTESSATATVKKGQTIEISPAMGTNGNTITTVKYSFDQLASGGISDIWIMNSQVYTTRPTDWED